jgi:cyclopropane fatty-acyl-phospholipid synthase-like methyltransferase
MAQRSLARMNSPGGDNGLAHHYAMWFEHLESDFRSASLTQLITAMIPAGQNVLDVGCGSGALSAALLQKGCRVISQDISGEMVDMCERYLRRKGLQGCVWHHCCPASVTQQIADDLLRQDTVED